MSLRGIWAIGAIAFALLGFILMVSPIAIGCSYQAPLTPLQLIEAISAGYTCESGYALDSYAFSALASFSSPFLGSAVCIVFYLASKPKA
jgi:uncharacterized membrane protein